MDNLVKVFDLIEQIAPKKLKLKEFESNVASVKNDLITKKDEPKQNNDPTGYSLFKEEIQKTKPVL